MLNSSSGNYELYTLPPEITLVFFIKFVVIAFGFLLDLTMWGDKDFDCTCKMQEYFGVSSKNVQTDR